MNRRTHMKRKTRLNSHVELVRRTRLRREGKKARENARINREKKAEHLRLGLTTCELRISEHCTPFENLSFAHSRKRRHQGKWGSRERAVNIRSSVLACNFCHDAAEVQGEAKMQPIIVAAIADRPNKIMEYV